MIKTITNRTYLWTEENVGKIMEAMRPPAPSLWNIRDWSPKDEGLSVMHSHDTEHGRSTSLMGFKEDRLYVAGFILEGSTISYYGNVIKDALRGKESVRDRADNVWNYTVEVTRLTLRELARIVEQQQSRFFKLSGGGTFGTIDDLYPEPRP